VDFRGGSALCTVSCSAPTTPTRARLATLQLADGTVPVHYDSGARKRVVHPKVVVIHVRRLALPDMPRCLHLHVHLLLYMVKDVFAGMTSKYWMRPLSKSSRRDRAHRSGSAVGRFCLFMNSIYPMAPAGSLIRTASYGSSVRGRWAQA